MSRPKSSKKYEAILKAAKSLFLKHGFADVSMDKIRDKANVSKNTIYNHFKDKEALFKAVISDHWQNEKTPKITTIENNDHEQRLLLFAKALLKHLHANNTRHLFRILVAESERFPKLAQSIITDNIPPIMLDFSNYIAREYGCSKEKATQLASYFFGLLKEDAFWHVLAGFRKPYTDEELDKHVKQVVAAFQVILKQLT